MDFLSMNIFNIYRGKPLDSSQKSVAVAYYLYNEKKTMEDKEIDQIMEKMITAYEQKLKAIIRK